MEFTNIFDRMIDYINKSFSSCLEHLSVSVHMLLCVKSSIKIYNQLLVMYICTKQIFYTLSSVQVSLATYCVCLT